MRSESARTLEGQRGNVGLRRPASRRLPRNARSPMRWRRPHWLLPRPSSQRLQRPSLILASVQRRSARDAATPGRPVPVAPDAKSRCGAPDTADQLPAPDRHSTRCHQDRHEGSPHTRPRHAHLAGSADSRGRSRAAQWDRRYVPEHLSPPRRVLTVGMREYRRQAPRGRLGRRGCRRRAG
jgi:hypothetical protein